MANNTKTQKCKSELALTQQDIAEPRFAQFLPSTGLAAPLCTAVVLVQLPSGVLCVSAPKLFPVAFNLVKSFMGEETQKKIVILGGK